METKTSGQWVDARAGSRTNGYQGYLLQVRVVSLRVSFTIGRRELLDRGLSGRRGFEIFFVDRSECGGVFQVV